MKIKKKQTEIGYYDLYTGMLNGIYKKGDRFKMTRLWHGEKCKSDNMVYVVKSPITIVHEIFGDDLGDSYLDELRFVKLEV